MARPRPAMIDQLKSIGIEKGKPFAPDGRTSSALRRERGRTRGLQKYELACRRFSERAAWTFPAPPDAGQSGTGTYRGPEWLSGRLRAASPTLMAISVSSGGFGQFYLSRSGTRMAKLRRREDLSATVPPNRPIEQYWSVTAYDRETHALIRNMNRAQAARRKFRECRRTPTARSISTLDRAACGKGNQLGSDRSGA